MRTETIRYGKKVVPKLYPDELLLVATQVKVLAREKPEGVGAGSAAPHWWSDADTIVAAVPLRTPVLWVLTDQRMLFFPTGHLRTAEPHVVLGRNHVTSIAATPAKVVFAKLALAFADGSDLELDLLTDRELGSINDAARIVLGR